MCWEVASRPCDCIVGAFLAACAHLHVDDAVILLDQSSCLSTISILRITMQTSLQLHLPCRCLPRQQSRVAPARQQQQQPPRRRPGVLVLRASLQDAPQHSSAQPLADISLGAGRLVSGLTQAITNPKEDKDLAKKRREWQKQQDEEKAKERAEKRQQEEQQQLELQQQEQDSAAGQLVDPLGLADTAAAAEAAGVVVAAEAAAVVDAAAAAAAATPEALAAAGQHSIVSEYTEELIEEAPKTMQQRVSDARQFLTSTATGKGLSIAAGLFLGATLLIAMYRTWQKYSSPRAHRMRVIDKNKLLVAELSKYLPDKRAELTPAVARRLRGSTGFTPVEVFRKYLWFLLRERQFDAAAVEDMVLLKQVLGLTDEEVAEALKERSQRIYDKYGTLMLNTEGMTAEGVEKKATCRALFSKLLYLTEHEPLLAQGSEAFKVADLRTIFGATDEDVDGLRIVSLYELDLEKMESLVNGQAAAEPAAAAAEPAAEKSGSQQQEGSSSSSSPPSSDDKK